MLEPLQEAEFRHTLYGNIYNVQKTKIISCLNKNICYNRSVWERFNPKKEKLLLPNFEASEQQDLLVEEYAKLQRESVAFSLDREGFSDEEVDRVKGRLQELKDELREYLLPYLELTQEPQEVIEHLRWDVAQSIHRKGRYKDHSWENWDRAESKYQKDRE